MPFTGPAGADTDLYVKPSVFRAGIGADLSVQQDAILAATQEPLAASALQEPSGPPAWKTIRSFALIGTQDMVLPPRRADLHGSPRRRGRGQDQGLAPRADLPPQYGRAADRKGRRRDPLTANPALAGGPVAGERWPLLAPSRSPAWKLDPEPFIARRPGRTTEVN